MSGIEIAAAVLKAFPLLLQAANKIYPIFEPCEFWWSFKEEFESFIDDVDYAMMTYRQHLSIFLQPLELNLEENTSMHKDPESPLWHDPSVRAKIRRRIPDEDYSRLLRQMEIMNDALQRLADMLTVDMLEFDDRGTIEHELNKLSLSFSKRRPQLLKQMRTANDRIGDYVKNERLISRQMNDENSSVTRTLQRYAAVFRQVLRDQLKCLSSTHIHRCAVAVNWTTSTSLGSGPPSLRILLGSNGGWRQLTWRVITSTELKPEKVAEARQPSELMSKHSRTLQVRKLRDGLATAAEQHRVGFAAVAAYSTALVPADNRTTKPWSRRQPVRLQKSKPHSLSFRKFGRSKSAHPAQEETDVMRQQSIAQPGGLPTATATSTRVQFSVPCQAGVSDTVESTTVTDFCSFLESSSTIESHGHLNLDHGRLLLQPEPSDQTSLQKLTMNELHEYALKVPRLPDRLRVGIQLARTILSFGASGWVPESLSRKQLSVLKDPVLQRDTPIMVYLSHECLANVLSRPVPSNLVQYGEAVLVSLGITLLELCDKMRLQQTPYWTQHSSHGIKEHTSLLAALDWQKDLADNNADLLSHPIKRCLKAQFNAHANLQDPKFVKEVFEGVIEPLEAFVAGWNMPAPMA